MSSSTPARIITFYSYKGGTGRSMALANIAWILASNSKRVLVVDWDLEAPGLQRYFRPFLVDRELVSSPGIVDLITAFVLEAFSPLENDQKLPPDWYLPLTDLDPYIISLDWKFPRGGKIDFIPAGQQGPEYALRLAAINWQKFYDVLGGGAFIEELKQKMRSGYDYVLIDSRTGVSDTSGICTIQMPDSLVICFTYNNQSIEGAASVTQGVWGKRFTQDSRPLSSLSAGNPQGNGSSGESYAHPYQFRVFPVPMRVDPFEKDKLDMRQVFARWRFDPFIERIPPAERRSYWTAVEVPYLPFFSYEEMLSPFKEDPTDPKSCLRAFIRIAREITHYEVEDFRSLTSPDQNYQVLQEFAKLPADFVASIQTGNGNRGGVRGEESEIEKLIRLADKTLQSLDAKQRDLARLMWMRLVRIPAPGENISNSKVRVQIEDLPQDSANAADAFAAVNLLTINRDVEARETTVEVTNEDLLRSWPSLNDWIKVDRDLMVWRQELQTSRARWLERNRVSTYLLTGRQLSEAKEWLQTHRQYFSPSEAEYVEQSIRENDRLENRKRKNQILGFAAVIMAVGLVVAAYSLYTKISSKTRLADEIATIAQEKIAVVNPENPEAADQLQLGILLAVEARVLAQSDKADNILKTALPALPKRVSSINVGPVLGMGITPDNSRLLIVGGRNSPSQNASEDRSAQVFDTTSGTIIGFMQFKQGSRLFQISPDGRYVSVSSLEIGSYLVTVMEPATGKVRATIQHRGPVYDMAFSPDGRYFATASSDGRTGVIDLNDEAAGSPPVYLDYPGTLNALAFSGDSRHLALAGEDFKVRVWKIIPGKPAWPSPSTIQMESTAFVLALSQTGEYLATLSLNNSVIDLWDVQNQKKINSLDNKPTPVNAISFTIDDHYLVAAGSGPLLGVWDLKGTKYEPQLRAYGNVSLLSFSLDGKYLAAVANNGPAEFWRYEGTFKTVGVLVPQIYFTNLEIGTSNRIVTADADNVVRIWQLVPEIGTEFLAEACSRLTRNLKAEEWNKYLEPSLGAYRRTCPELP